MEHSWTAQEQDDCWLGIRLGTLCNNTHATLTSAFTSDVDVSSVAEQSLDDRRLAGLDGDVKRSVVVL